MPDGLARHQVKEVPMEKFIEEIWTNELLYFNSLIEDVLRIPDEVFRLHGVSAMTLTLKQATAEIPSRLALVHQPGHPSQIYATAEDDFQTLCNSAPHVPTQVMEAVSLGYASLLLLQTDTTSSPQSQLLALIEIAAVRGMALGAMPGAEAEHQRSQLLSSAGLKGARGKHAKTNALKAWALKAAQGIKKGHKEIARELFANIPEELRDASDDPERFMYDAIRADAAARKGAKHSV